MGMPMARSWEEKSVERWVRARWILWEWERSSASLLSSTFGGGAGAGGAGGAGAVDEDEDEDGVDGVGSAL
jgi:hypothetical protein